MRYSKKELENLINSLNEYSSNEDKEKLRKALINYGYNLNDNLASKVIKIDINLINDLKNISFNTYLLSLKLRLKNNIGDIMAINYSFSDLPEDAYEQVLMIVFKYGSEKNIIHFLSDDFGYFSYSLKDIANKYQYLIKSNVEKIISKNPPFIHYINEQTARIQIIALQNALDTKEVFSLLKDPSDISYAYMLTKFDKDDEIFKNMFIDGVPQNIANHTINFAPYMVSKDYIRNALSGEYLDNILLTNPMFIKYYDESQITLERLILLVKTKPLEVFNYEIKRIIFSERLLNIAKENMSKLTEKEQLIFLEKENNYRNEIADIENKYNNLINFNSQIDTIREKK